MGAVVTDRLVIESDGKYNAVPAVEIAANGDWVLTYRKGTDNVSTPQVITRRSLDQGRTWSPEEVICDATGIDPTLVRTPDGSLFLEFTSKDQVSKLTGAAYTLSADNGLTWGALTFLTTPVSAISALPTRIITVAGVLYASGFGPFGDGSFDASLWRSTDSGNSWTMLSTIRQPGDAGINETSIEYLGGSKLVSINRADDGLHTYAHFSYDMGQTWSNQQDYTAQLTVLDLPQLLQLPNVLLLFGRGPNNALVVFASTDDAVTFENETVLDTYTGLGIDGGYCWPLVRPDGKIFVVYYADSNKLRKPDIKSLVLTWDTPPSLAFGGSPHGPFSYSAQRLAERAKTKDQIGRRLSND